VLFNPGQVPKDTLKGYSEQEILDWKTGYDVVTTLRKRGHEVEMLSLQDDLRPIRQSIETFKPHIVFNLLEEFHGEAAYDQNVASYLQLLRIPYTGCNPRGLMLARGKDLSKKLVHYHRIPTPAFAVFPMRRKVKRPTRLQFPLIVKSLTEDASFGIAKASLVSSDEKLQERVAFIHDKVGTDAIAEQYIDGRELYVAVLGNERLRTFPIWELHFGPEAEGSGRIATERLKFDINYQERRGVNQEYAKDIAPDIVARIHDITKRICRTLELDGYSRIDFRLSAEGVPYFLEANPNPDIASHEVFAASALRDGLKFPHMLERILALGMSRARASTPD
jgi:D-alanine-D-alanine ligase